MITRKWSIKLAALCVLATVVFVNAASAAGLGELTVNTALNEPLAAEISLINIESIDDGLLSVRLAPASAFAKAGVTRDYYLTQLSFFIDTNAAGQTVIKVASKESILEPYLDFIVELEWPEGRVLREYTVLLDQPTDVGGTAVDGHRVVAGDTLWNVSKRLRPSGSTILQTMDALYNENITAFVDGDANKIIEGALLRLPSNDDISGEVGDIVFIQIGLAEQIPENVVRGSADSAIQNSFDDASEDSNTGGTPSLDAANASSAASPSGMDLVEDTSAFINQPVVEVAAVTDNADGYEQLSSELADAQDEMNRAELENAELRKRMALLEAQVDLMSDLATGSGSQVTADGEPPATNVVKAVASKADNFFSLVKQLPNQPWYTWAGIGLFALLLLGFLRRSKTNNDVHDGSGSEESLQDDYDQEPEVNTGANLLIDDLDGLDLDLEKNLFDETDKEIFPEDDSAVSPEIFDSMVETLAEAEVYLSLGNIDQAIDILEEARAADAADTVSRLKLMEIYASEERGDKVKAIELEIGQTGDEMAIGKASVIRGPEKEILFDSPKIPETANKAETPLGLDQTAEEKQGVDISDLLDDGATPDDDMPTDALEESVLAGDFLEDDFMDGIFSEEPASKATAPNEANLELLGEAELKQTVGEGVSKGFDDLQDFDGQEDIDAVDVKLDLANTYIEMGDLEDAREILQEIIDESDQHGQAKARAVLEKL